MNLVDLDSQKAVGKVPHQRLLKKRSCHGIAGIISWSKSWLQHGKGWDLVVGMEKSQQWGPRGISAGTSFVQYITNDWSKE